MNILITGVPGTGKSTIARRLAKKLKYHYIDLNKIVKEEQLWEYEEDGALVVDVDALEGAVKERMGWKNCVIDGHLGCDMKLPVDLVIILRASPEVLKRRLSKRKYSDRKITSNILCEALDYCTIKAEENYDDVREITTNKSISKIMGDIEEILKDELAFKAGKISWKQELEKLAQRAAELS